MDVSLEEANADYSTFHNLIAGHKIKKATSVDSSNLTVG